MNMVFDLDGTLIDSKLRLYRLFQHLATDSTLSYEQYWAFKQKKISNDKLLSSLFGFSEKQITEFTTRWMSLIESQEFLALDSNFAGMESALGVLKQHADLHVCTARQRRQPVLDQLESLNLAQFFQHVLVTEQICRKETLIATNIPSLSSKDWLVGDTGKDIQVGKSLKLNTCAVLSGFLNREALIEYCPDVILNSVTDFVLPADA